MYRPMCSEMLSGLCSAFGTCWVVQCHPSIESNPRISTTEHVHALYFLYHIGCTVTINRVKKFLKRCHSIGWKRSCDNQKFNRKEYFTKSLQVFQTATVRNLLTRQQSSKYLHSGGGLSAHVTDVTPSYFMCFSQVRWMLSQWFYPSDFHLLVSFIVHFIC
jgi:hypothetical protein